MIIKIKIKSIQKINNNKKINDNKYKTNTIIMKNNKNNNTNNLKWCGRKHGLQT